jgi:transposase
MVPLEQAVERLMTMPGVDRRTAQNALAEIGADTSRLPTAGERAVLARGATQCVASKYLRQEVSLQNNAESF